MHSRQSLRTYAFPGKSLGTSENPTGRAYAATSRDRMR